MDPTLPNPWTATLVPLTGIPSFRSASRVTSMHPRPVASRRPREPPISTGLPVTTAVTVWRLCMEYVSMIHAIIRSLVLTSGAGTSESGPRVSMIAEVYRRVIRSSSALESWDGSQTTPPLEPPKGMFTTAHFQVIQAASAFTSSSVTFRSNRMPPLAGPREVL